MNWLWRAINSYITYVEKSKTYVVKLPPVSWTPSTWKINKVW